MLEFLNSNCIFELTLRNLTEKLTHIVFLKLIELKIDCDIL